MFVWHLRTAAASIMCELRILIKTYVEKLKLSEDNLTLKVIAGYIASQINYFSRTETKSNIVVSC